ncbi:alpha/beta hydrolase [soil metagenome]
MSPHAVQYRSGTSSHSRLFLHQWTSAGWSPTEGETVVFLHGMGAYSGANAIELAQRVCEAGRVRLLAPDLPGYGRTPAAAVESFDPAATAQLVAEFLGGASGDTATHVVGHSRGADIAAFLAVDSPARVASLVLLDGGIAEWERVPTEVVRADAANFDERCRYRSMKDYFASLRGQFRRWSPELEWAFERAAEVSDGSVRLVQRPEVYAGIRQAGISRQVSSVWTELPRALHLAGAESPLLPPPAEAGQVQCETVRRSGHFLLEDAPDYVAARLRRWWSDELARLAIRAATP